MSVHQFPARSEAIRREQRSMQIARELMDQIDRISAREVKIRWIALVIMSIDNDLALAELRRLMS